MKNKSLTSIELAKELRVSLYKIYGKYLSEDGVSVNYKQILESDEFNQSFLILSEKLAYCTTTNLVENPSELLSFFINIYNILHIHGRIKWFVDKKTFEMGLREKSNFYNVFKYNIGGYNYSLNDIEHGILRKNNNFGGSFISVYNLICKGKITGNNEERFNIFDPRRQFLVKIVDPRIHFALNCGAKSCPPIKLYEPENIEKQLDIASKSFCSQEVFCFIFSNTN